MAPGEAAKDLIRFFRMLSTLAYLLFAGVGILVMITSLWKWISNSWNPSDLYMALWAIAWVSILVALQAFNRWTWNKQIQAIERRRQPTPEEIEAARVMLYGDRKPKD